MIEAKQGILTLHANLIGSGLVQIDQNATLELAGTSDATITFQGGYTTTLMIHDVDGFTGTIKNFKQGDVIELPHARKIPHSDSVSATYGLDDDLTLRTIGTINVTGPDPVPTFGLKLVDRSHENRGVDIETARLHNLLDLSF